MLPEKAAWIWRGGLILEALCVAAGSNTAWRVEEAQRPNFGGAQQCLVCSDAPWWLLCWESSLG